MARKAKLRIGTSGWNYKHWRGPFYPEKLKQSEWLNFYSEHFDTVEVNNSFYKLPQVEVLERWRDIVPEGFLFAFKGSRYITHMKRLKDPHEHVPKLLDRIQVVGKRLGPILYQLPTGWKCNVERLANFLEALPAGKTFVLEFRDPSWYDDSVMELLSRHGMGFCIHDMREHLSPREAPSEVVYIRFHGSSDRKYHGEYGKKGLSPWAGAISSWLDQGKSVYCYFNNDPEGHAVKDAMRLKEMLQ